MQNISEKTDQVNFWLDLKSGIDSLLEFATPEKHLDILEIIYEAYIQSEFADMGEERRAVSVQYGIFKEILKTLNKHAINTTADFKLVSA